jgi:hypothetical protein
MDIHNPFQDSKLAIFLEVGDEYLISNTGKFSPNFHLNLTVTLSRHGASFRIILAKIEPNHI